MKKQKKAYFLLALALIMSLAVFAPVSAARLSDFDTKSTPIMKGTPAVDGEKDELYNYSVQFERPYLYHYAEEGGNLPAGEFKEEDFGVKIKATISLLYDENNLYVFVEVTDDKFYASNDDTLGYWMQGSGVINMYYPGDSGGSNEIYYKLRIANGAAAYNATAHGTDDDFADDCNYVYKETANGWNLEYQIKLAKPIKQGDPFQFALQVCSASPDKNMGFAHVNENYAQITFPFVLGGPVVIPEPETEPVPEVIPEPPAPATDAPAVAEPPPPTVPVPPTGDVTLLMLAAISAVSGFAAFRKKEKK